MGLVEKADDGSDDEAEHARDGRVPDVRNLVDLEVGEVLTEKDISFTNRFMTWVFN